MAILCILGIAVTGLLVGVGVVVVPAAVIQAIRRVQIGIVSSTEMGEVGTTENVVVGGFGEEVQQERPLVNLLDLWFGKFVHEFKIFPPLDDRSDGARLPRSNLFISEAGSPVLRGRGEKFVVSPYGDIERRTFSSITNGWEDGQLSVLTDTATKLDIEFPVTPNPRMIDARTAGCIKSYDGNPRALVASYGFFARFINFYRVGRVDDKHPNSYHCNSVSHSLVHGETLPDSDYEIANSPYAFFKFVVGVFFIWIGICALYLMAVHLILTGTRLLWASAAITLGIYLVHDFLRA